jgi:photosystem I P700 chlorophyll a apoprotein A2
MFLISWRGYWQEIIETILVVHNRTPIVYDLWEGSTILPLALSIVEARFVGLVHFGSGFILSYASFAIGSSS